MPRLEEYVAAFAGIDGAYAANKLAVGGQAEFLSQRDLFGRCFGRPVDFDVDPVGDDGYLRGVA